MGSKTESCCTVLHGAAAVCRPRLATAAARDQCGGARGHLDAASTRTEASRAGVRRLPYAIRLVIRKFDSALAQGWPAERALQGELETL